MRITTKQKTKLIELAARYNVDLADDLKTLVIDETTLEHICFYPRTRENTLVIAVFPDGTTAS